MNGLKRQSGSKGADPDQIYEKILTAIFERKLHPGTRLKEEELCEVFGAGRGAIRKVLQWLSHENLVRIVPNSGAFVAEPTVAESKEVFQARRLIEAELVRELAENFTPAKAEALREHVAKEQEAHDNGDYSRRIRLSGEYHLLIGKLAEKPVMTEFLREIISRTSLIIALYERTKSSFGPLPPSCDHITLIEVLEAGHVEQAVGIMLDHLCVIEKALNLDPPTEDTKDLKNIFA
ncbi:GntR family transcriptional regulator [Marinobacterium lutimaris]|uniref:Transcriptional regulator, GntR family n=1 Tax=Marinobacterium lutimaris TaxID=568106 RepID=A0A1H6AQY0_9GAMM|nr:GntR family transcriptional regulator [Marinobacterium lutimaris]SEG51108.1 transcriptional regulator, GntR family [Marinobacterium lutimaris]